MTAKTTFWHDRWGNVWEFFADGRLWIWPADKSKRVIKLW